MEELQELLARLKDEGAAAQLTAILAPEYSKRAKEALAEQLFNDHNAQEAEIARLERQAEDCRVLSKRRIEELEGRVAFGEQAYNASTAALDTVTCCLMKAEAERDGWEKRAQDANGWLERITGRFQFEVVISEMEDAIRILKPTHGFATERLQAVLEHIAYLAREQGEQASETNDVEQPAEEQSEEYDEYDLLMDTDTAIGVIAEELAENPGNESLLLTLESLQKRRDKLEAESPPPEERLREILLDALVGMVQQHCVVKAGPTDYLDSMGLSANATAMALLAECGALVLESECGRRVIGHWPTPTPTPEQRLRVLWDVFKKEEGINLGPTEENIEARLLARLVRWHEERGGL